MGTLVDRSVSSNVSVRQNSGPDGESESIDPVTKQEKFKKRIVHAIAVTAKPSKHPKFIALQRGLLDLLAPELRRVFQAKRYSDVLSFIALLLDGGEVDGSLDDDVFQVRLFPAWSHGLDDLPGYDADARLVRLTTNLEVNSDSAGNPVGHLGRAHPLVRRALDRVRNLSFGAAARKGQDPRASVVRANVPEPALLFTFIGRLSNRRGRELERVLAVQVTPHGETKLLDSPDHRPVCGSPRTCGQGPAVADAIDQGVAQPSPRGRRTVRSGAKLHVGRTRSRDRRCQGRKQFYGTRNEY